MKKELWKFIPGLDNLYSASTHGRIRSHDTRVHTYGGRWKTITGRVLRSVSSNSSGHQRVTIKRKGVFVHRLVLETFVGPCPTGHQCRHLDGNPRNNHINNLAWGTPKENARDRKSHGRDQLGVNNYMAKLTPQQVIEIRDTYVPYAPGKSQLALSKKYGVSQRTVWQIVHNITWKHLD